MTTEQIAHQARKAMALFTQQLEDNIIFGPNLINDPWYQYCTNKQPPKLPERVFTGKVIEDTPKLLP